MSSRPQRDALPLSYDHHRSCSAGPGFGVRPRPIAPSHPPGAWPARAREASTAWPAPGARRVSPPRAAWRRPRSARPPGGAGRSRPGRSRSAPRPSSVRKLRDRVDCSRPVRRAKPPSVSSDVAAICAIRPSCADSEVKLRQLAVEELGDAPGGQPAVPAGAGSRPGLQRPCAEFFAIAAAYS